ncbi:hypothetical protein ASPWEDRAFT_70344 [Aspergillus wentii DTO 134E9]|uniref:Uncharacterized protein n=1 Tax=Aspergillus wentii DTO 134E9 TaxID=1073089 RepID=A0A1L9RCM2_ASPWE|nr:uncharacterized protein ASPWEDRAFT_70344 [Aspergillus wentii DTO 134E9]KAI9924246.1 hypothetical protein MW887_007196 [Aspergillus wentii]OJJ32662.1 hypothetical protein ASPWEDRAFT_70344 [Aspergillus wentii DTO 134E9]
MASLSDPDPEKQNTESPCPNVEKGPSQGSQSQPSEAPRRRGFKGQIIAPTIYAHPIKGTIVYVGTLVLFYKGCRYRGGDKKTCRIETNLFRDLIFIVLMALIGWDILMKRRAQRRIPQTA